MNFFVKKCHRPQNCAAVKIKDTNRHKSLRLKAYYNNFLNNTSIECVFHCFEDQWLSQYYDENFCDNSNQKFLTKIFGQKISVLFFRDQHFRCSGCTRGNSNIMGPGSPVATTWTRNLHQGHLYIMGIPLGIATKSCENFRHENPLTLEEAL